MDALNDQRFLFLASLALARTAPLAIIIIAEAAFDFTARALTACGRQRISQQRGFAAAVNYATLFGARRC
jgi:hypothetical protein